MNDLLNNPKRKRQRRFLLVLPLIALPCITLFFWALGGGKGDSDKNAAAAGGLNVKLPEARIRDGGALDKLSYYAQAKLDAEKLRAAEKLDPYWNKIDSDSSQNESTLQETDPNKIKVYEKLDALKQVLQHAEQSQPGHVRRTTPGYSLKSYAHTREVDRLQEMMQRMQANNASDPEMEQLNAMLDKIQAIQHPEKQTATLSQPGNKTYALDTKKNEASISLLKNDMPLPDTLIAVQQNRFFGISGQLQHADTATAAIECTIPETQTLVSGATVKLALTKTAFVKNKELPAGTAIYGLAALANERLKIKISSIRLEQSLLPVNLSVYDMDGQEGIYIPGSISRTVSKESADKAISNVDATMIDPSLGAQAASAGIEAAKTLFSKKVKLIRITVRSGYQVLLHDNNSK